MSDQTEIISVAEENTLKTTHGEKGTFILFPVRATGITGVVTLKNTKVIDNDTGEAINSKRLRGTSLDVIPKDRLSFLSRTRDDIRAAFRKHGFNLGGSLFMVHESKVSQVLEMLKQAKDSFDNGLEEFLDSYDEMIEGEIILNPSIAKLIEAHAPNKDKIARSCKFKVGTPQAINVGTQHMLESDLFDDDGDYFSDEVVTSFCNDVTHFWRYSLQTAKKVLETDGKDRENFINPIKKRSGLRGSCIMILKNIRDKAEDVTAINPAFANVVDYMDSQMELIGGYKHNTFIKDLNTAKGLLTLAENLKCEEFIHSLLSVKVDESLAAELVESTNVTTNTSEPTQPQTLSHDDLFDDNSTDVETDSNDVNAFSLETLMAEDENAKPEEQSALSVDDLFESDISDVDQQQSTNVSVKLNVSFAEKDVEIASDNYETNSGIEGEQDIAKLTAQEEVKAQALTETFSIDDLFK